MSGYHTILKCERIKEHADKLGFMLCYPRHGWGGTDNVDTVAIKPKDKDSLPIYARDAQFFSGTIDEMESFLRGIEWARDYDRMLRVSTDANSVLAARYCVSSSQISRIKNGFSSGSKHIRSIPNVL